MQQRLGDPGYRAIAADLPGTATADYPAYGNAIFPLPLTREVTKATGLIAMIPHQPMKTLPEPLDE